MAFTDREGKIVLHSWGRFRMRASGSDIDVGDLGAWDTGSADEGLKVATDTVEAVAIACENITDTEMGWWALAAELQAPPSVASAGGAVTQGYFDTTAAAALLIRSDPLYTTAAGKCTGSSSTTTQIVGHVIDQDRIMLCPGAYLTSTDLNLSGTLTVTGTSSFTGDITLASGGDITLVKGNVTITEYDAVLTKGNVNMTAGDITVTLGNCNLTAGNVILTAGDLDMVAGNITMTAGYVKNVRVTNKTATATLTDAEQGFINVSPAAATILTLPTAAAGKEFTIFHFKTAQNINVLCGSGDKITDPADGGVSDYLYDDKGLENLVTLHAINNANWIAINKIGTWTGA